MSNPNLYQVFISVIYSSEILSKIERISKNFHILERNVDKYIDEYGFNNRAFTQKQKYQSLKHHFEKQIEGKYKHLKKLKSITENNNLPQNLKDEKQREILKTSFELKELINRQNRFESFLKYKDSIHSIELLGDVLSGKKEICVVDTAAQEIDRHIIENKDKYPEPKDENFFYMSKSEADFLLKKCSLVTYRDNISNKIMNELVSILQGKNSPLLEKMKMKPFPRAMDEDMNENGVYGDALILVQSNMAGLPFVSLNKKDFFADYNIKNVDKDTDETIRKRIEYIMENFPLFSNAPIYKPNEFMSEGRKQIRIVTPITETIEEKNSNRYNKVVVKGLKEGVIPEELLGPQM